MNKLFVVNFGFCSNNTTGVYLACKFMLYKVYTSYNQFVLWKVLIMHEVAALCHTVGKLFQTINRKIMQASIKPSPVLPAFLYYFIRWLAGLKVRMAGHSNRVCRKLASAYKLLTNFELQLWDRHPVYVVYI